MNHTSSLKISIRVLQYFIDCIQLLISQTQIIGSKHMSINNEQVHHPPTTAAQQRANCHKLFIDNFQQLFSEVDPEQIDAFLRENKIWEYQVRQLFQLQKEAIFFGRCEKADRLRERLESFTKLKMKMEDRKWSQQLSSRLIVNENERKKRVRRFKRGMRVISLVFAIVAFKICEGPLQQLRLPSFNEWILGVGYTYISMFILCLTDGILMR